MKSQDDPEARIRELERPMAEQARASELGVTSRGATYYPPPPPMNSAVPPMPQPFYGGPPVRARGGSRGWWLVSLGVLAAVGVIIAMAVGSFSSMLSEIRPFLESDDDQSSVPSVPAIPPVANADSTVVNPGEQLNVSGVDSTKTILCNQGTVTVSGVGHTLVITGHCANVTVSGVNNVVSIESSDTIVASGMDNALTYHSGIPAITNSGMDNTVELG